MIRRLLVLDLPLLLKLERESQPQPWTAEALQEELAHVDGEVLGLFWGLALVGHICLRRIVDELWILNLATHPEQRRQGIASDLLVAAKERATSTSLSLWLEVREGNTAAQVLYLQQGLAVVGRRPGYYPGLRPENTREAAILFAWSPG